MNSLLKFGALLKQPNRIVAAILSRFLLWLPEKLYICLRFRLLMGYKLDFDNPKTFNEKLNWLKLYNRNPLYPTLVDKVTVKEYVAKIIGEKYVIPTLGVWDEFDEIDFDCLPNQFVLKSTNGGGSNGVAICHEKSKFKIDSVKKKLLSSMKTNWKVQKEWVYYDVKPRILAEQYLVNHNPNTDLLDYKFFCFNGKVGCYKVDFDRFSDHRANYYDRDSNILPFGEIQCPPKPDAEINKRPENFNLMVELAESLAMNIPFVRIDFYNLDGTIFFGEMTFFPDGGFGRFTDRKWEYKLGEMLDLSTLQKNK